MGDKSWKRNEREVAKDLGVKRNWRGTLGDIPDVIDNHLSVEVKNTKSVPKFLYDVLEQAKSHSEGNIPLAVVRRKGKHTKVAIIDWKDFLKIYNKISWTKKRNDKE